MVLDNDNGTAPGLIMEKDGKHAILLPGPPNELYPLFSRQVYPISAEAAAGDHCLPDGEDLRYTARARWRIRLLDLIDAQTNPTIATYAKTGEVHLRVTAKVASQEEAEKLIKPVVKEIKKRFGECSLQR